MFLYIYKYVTKPKLEKAAISINNKNEVESYLIGRYNGIYSSAWKLLGLPMHDRYPNVQKLAVHTDNLEKK